MHDYLPRVGLGLGLLRVVSAVSVVSGGVEYVGSLAEQVPEQESFLGIPYAHAGRFERPSAPTVSSPFNATVWGDICPQPWDIPGLVQSENCLSANIWRPTGTTSKDSLPVMVFIYGGSYSNGEAIDYPMSGFGETARLLYGKPIVGVNFNYRTGLFGFPVGAEAEKHKALNLGLYDQRAALEWIQKHIADFGGNPSKVTLFGHSAGAVSVGLQMLYNGGQLGGAFQRGVMQSGSPSTLSSRSPSTPARERAMTYLADNTGCGSAADKFACLQTVDFAALSAAHVAVYPVDRNYVVLDYPWSVFTPAVSSGDSFLPIRAYEAVAAGKFAKIPFISGDTLDEGTILTPVTQSKQETIDFLTLAVPGSDLGFADDVAAITNLVNNVYSDNPADGSPYGTGAETFGTSPYYKQAASITGDLQFEGPRRIFLREAIKNGVQVWSYRWMQDVGMDDVFPPAVGVSHAQEIYTEFRNSAVTPEAWTVGNVFIDYLSSFAYANSDNEIIPAGSGFPAWTPYTANSKKMLQFLHENYTMVNDDYRTKEIEIGISTVLSVN